MNSNLFWLYFIEQLGIVHINPEKSNKYKDLLVTMAQANPKVVFMDLTP